MTTLGIIMLATLKVLAWFVPTLIFVVIVIAIAERRKEVSDRRLSHEKHNEGDNQ